MPNWNSQRREYRPVVKEGTKRTEGTVRRLREEGKTTREIARTVGKSRERVREHLRKPKSG